MTSFIVKGVIPTKPGTMVGNICTALNEYMLLTATEEVEEYKVVSDRLRLLIKDTTV